MVTGKILQALLYIWYTVNTAYQGIITAIELVSQVKITSNKIDEGRADGAGFLSTSQ